MLDTLDFHHVAEDIARGDLNPRYVPNLRSAYSVLDATPWPDGLGGIATSLKDNAAELEIALIEKREGDAKHSSQGVHEQEHAPSHEANEWLSSR